MNIFFAATAFAVTLAAAPALSAVVLDQDNLMTVTNGGYSNLIGGALEGRQAQFVTSHRTGN